MEPILAMTLPKCVNVHVWLVCLQRGVLLKQGKNDMLGLNLEKVGYSEN